MCSLSSNFSNRPQYSVDTGRLKFVTVFLLVFNDVVSARMLLLFRGVKIINCESVKILKGMAVTYLEVLFLFSLEDSSPLVIGSAET